MTSRCQLCEIDRASKKFTCVFCKAHCHYCFECWNPRSSMDRRACCDSCFQSRFHPIPRVVTVEECLSVLDNIVTK